MLNNAPHRLILPSVLTADQQWLIDSLLEDTLYTRAKLNGPLQESAKNIYLI